MEQTGEKGVQREVQPEQLPAEKPAEFKIERSEKGWFKKGVSAHPQGRAKGTQTERVKILKNFAESALLDNASRFNSEMRKLKGKQLIDTYIALMDFCLPRLARVDGTQLNINANREPQTLKIGETEIIIN